MYYRRASERKGTVIHDDKAPNAVVYVLYSCELGLPSSGSTPVNRKLYITMCERERRFVYSLEGDWDFGARDLNLLRREGCTTKVV